MRFFGWLRPIERPRISCAHKDFVRSLFRLVRDKKSGRWLVWKLRGSAPTRQGAIEIRDQMLDEDIRRSGYRP